MGQKRLGPREKLKKKPHSYVILCVGYFLRARCVLVKNGGRTWIGLLRPQQFINAAREALTAHVVNTYGNTRVRVPRHDVWCVQGGLCDGFVCVCVAWIVCVIIVAVVMIVVLKFNDY